MLRISPASHSGAAPSGFIGVQRRQGRKPAVSASRVLPKNSTFSRLGFFAGQVGRQKMPVVRTPR